MPTLPRSTIAPLLTTGDVARILSVDPKTVERWRSSGGGPPWCRVGKSHATIRYCPEAFRSWVAERTAAEREAV